MTTSKFILACRNGTAERVKELLTTKLLTRPDELGNFPLHIACARGAEDIVTIMLDKPGSVVMLQNRSNAIPLHIAAKNGYLDIVNLLLEHIPERQVLATDAGGSIPLHLATRMGHLEVVQALLQYQPDLQVTRTVITLYAPKNVPLIIQYLTGQSTGAFSKGPTSRNLIVNLSQSWRPRLPLHFACERGHVEIANQLLIHEPGPQVLHTCGSDYTATVLFTLCGVEERTRIEQAALIAASVLSIETEKQISNSQMCGVLWNRWKDNDHWFHTLLALFREGVLRESDLPKLASEPTQKRLREAVAEMRQPKSARSVCLPDS